MASSVRTVGPSIETGAPQRLYRANVIAVFEAGGYQHDIDNRGRFFAYHDGSGSHARALTVMLNWAKALKH